MAFQMKDMNKGYYNLTPLASSEMVCWNKERTAERVAGALDEYVYRTRARAADSCMYGLPKLVPRAVCLHSRL